MSERAKLGLCLGGGGITGAMYEVGCLAALEDVFDGFSASEFDVYVGTSSGSTVAAVLAGGFPALRLYRALLDPADDFFPLKRNHLLRFDGKEWTRVAKSVVGATRHFLSSAASSPLELDVWNELDRFWDSLPAGIFTLDPYERFLEAFFARRQIPLWFDDLSHTLFVVANDVDRGERAVFGASVDGVDAIEDITIPKAICASVAIPMLFAPVRVDDRDFIDGGMGAVAHADLAASAGCSTVLIINPMVPVRPHAEDGVPTGHGKRRRVRDKGLIWVSSQAWRLRSEARLTEGLAKWRAERADTTLLLLEPDPDDATMFMYSPMNFAARRAILEDGYVRTRRLLEQGDAPLRRALLEAGLRDKPA